MSTHPTIHARAMDCIFKALVYLREFGKDVDGAWCHVVRSGECHYTMALSPEPVKAQMPQVLLLNISEWFAPKCLATLGHAVACNIIGEGIHSSKVS